MLAFDDSGDDGGEERLAAAWDGSADLEDVDGVPPKAEAVEGVPKAGAAAAGLPNDDDVDEPNVPPPNAEVPPKAEVAVLETPKGEAAGFVASAGSCFGIAADKEEGCDANAPNPPLGFGASVLVIEAGFDAKEAKPPPLPPVEPKAEPGAVAAVENEAGLFANAEKAPEADAAGGAPAMLVCPKDV